jgi:hypothetical protein
MPGTRLNILLSLSLNYFHYHPTKQVLFPLFLSFFFYFLWYWDLNSGPTPCATPSTSPFGYFQDGISQAICPLKWLWTLSLLISASQVARIIGVSHQHPALCLILKKLSLKYLMHGVRHWDGWLPIQHLSPEMHSKVSPLQKGGVYHLLYLIAYTLQEGTEAKDGSSGLRLTTQEWGHGTLSLALGFPSIK